jgi:homeobox protein cut-like
VRAVQALNPVERGVFLLTRQILGNRRARIAFAIYAGALHLLVLVTLYECSSFGGGGGGGAIRVSEPPAKAWS